MQANNNHLSQLEMKYKALEADYRRVLQEVRTRN